MPLKKFPFINYLKNKIIKLYPMSDKLCRKNMKNSNIEKQINISFEN